MTILLINQFFWPDSAATSQLLTDLARGLADCGHKVHAISMQASYAPADDAEPPAVDIHRIRAVPFVRGAAGRMASYASFFLGAAWRGMRVPRPDVVITLTTPPLLSLLGTLIQTLRGSRHYIWEMDVYPDVAVDLGYIQAGSFLDHLIGSVADFSRKRADGILALGPCMRDRLLRRGIDAAKIQVADNWADGNIIRPVAWPPLGSPLTVLYSGNLGLAHDIETVRYSLAHLKDDDRYRFVFAGSGAQRAELEKWCARENIRIAEFRPYSSKARLGESLGVGHIGLITQKDSCLGSVVPSKLYGLLAAGRPVLFIGPRASTVARIIRRFDCGWQVDCGDGARLVELLSRLELDRVQLLNAGLRARKAFVENYNRPLGVARVCRLIGASPGEESLSFLKTLTTDYRRAPAVNS